MYDGYEVMDSLRNNKQYGYNDIDSAIVSASIAVPPEYRNFYRQVTGTRYLHLIRHMDINRAWEIVYGQTH